MYTRLVGRPGKLSPQQSGFFLRTEFWAQGIFWQTLVLASTQRAPNVASSILCKFHGGLSLPGAVQVADEAEDDAVGRRSGPAW